MGFTMSEEDELAEAIAESLSDSSNTEFNDELTASAANFTNVADDGNCLYSAIALAGMRAGLFRFANQEGLTFAGPLSEAEQAIVMQLRTLVQNEFAKNFDKYKAVIEEAYLNTPGLSDADKDAYNANTVDTTAILKEKYVNRITDDSRFWGGGAELLALANVLGIQILSTTSSKTDSKYFAPSDSTVNSSDAFESNNPATPSIPTIHICRYVRKSHFGTANVQTKYQGTPIIDFTTNPITISSVNASNAAAAAPGGKSIKELAAELMKQPGFPFSQQNIANTLAKTTAARSNLKAAQNIALNSGEPQGPIIAARSVKTAVEMLPVENNNISSDAIAKLNITQINDLCTNLIKSIDVFLVAAKTGPYAAAANNLSTSVNQDLDKYKLRKSHQGITSG